ncbi:MAG: malonyl-ACP O-methyltransferase BioC [Gammaproteobacteria bacterium]
MNGVDKTKVAVSFDAAAAHYEQRAILQKTIAERLVERLELVNVNPTNIIDLGSVTGMAARMLAQKYNHARILQLDISHQMLIQSRRLSPRFFSRHSFVCGDVEYLPVDSLTADLIFSSLTLQWCNDLDLAFVEAKRALRTNGLFIFATLGPDTLKELRESWAVVDDNIHVNSFFDMHDIGDALVRAGMEGVVMDVENIKLTYKDSLDLMRELKILGAHNVNINRHKALTGKGKLERVIQEYEKYRENDTLPVNYEVVYGQAWKPLSEASVNKNGQTSYIPISSIKRTGK